MRRTIALLVSATAVLIAASSAAAQPVAPTPIVARLTRAETGSAVPADAVGLAPAQGTAPGLAATLDAGASEEHDVVISNHTANLRLTVRLTATDASGATGAGPGAWLAFGTDVVELAPHAAVTVPMTIAVPHDTQPGSALAHAVATVESAASTSDGSPRLGIARATLPVSVEVTGASTAQIAIADVRRVDKGSEHVLAVVLQNFGIQGAAVSGQVRVGGDRPQTLPFSAQLASSGDTTVDVPWNAPPVGTAVDLAIAVDYGGGNTASWSSLLGGPPSTIANSVPADVTPTTAGTPVADPAVIGSTTPAPRPWWDNRLLWALALVALLGAAGWFVAEFRRSGRRPIELPEYPFMTAPVGWVPDSAGTSLVLSEQLVALTDAIVGLAAHREAPEPQAPEPAAVAPVLGAPVVHPPAVPMSADRALGGRGPAPPPKATIDEDDEFVAAVIAALASEPDVGEPEVVPSARSASPTPSEPSRPPAVPIDENASAAELRAADEAEAELRREALRLADEEREARRREAARIAARNADEKRAADQLEEERLAAVAAEQQRAEAENARRAQEFHEAEERRAAEWRAAEMRRSEERRAAELAAEEARRVAEVRAAEDRHIEERLAAERAAEELRLADTERRAAERAAERRAEEREAEDRRVAEAERRAQRQREIDERRAVEAEQRAEERRRADEARAAERELRLEERRAEDLRLAEERRLAEELRIQERRAAEELQAERLRVAEREAEEQRAEARRVAEQVAEDRRLAAEERRAAERRADEERRAERKRAEERETEERLAALEQRRAEERVARERAMAERAIAERLAEIARDRRAAEMAAEKRAMEERLAQEQLSERVSERVVAESAAAQRISEEIRAAERLAERTEERLRAEREIAERIEAERRADRAAERLAQDRVAAERAAAEQLAEERRAERLAERAAQDRLAADRAAQERLAAERLARERFAEIVALRAAAENLAQERLAQERAAQARLAQVQVSFAQLEPSGPEMSTPTPTPTPPRSDDADAALSADLQPRSSRPPEADGRIAALERLAQLERERRASRSWMDEDDEVVEERWVPEDALLRLVGSTEPAPPSDEG